MGKRRFQSPIGTQKTMVKIQPKNGYANVSIPYRYTKNRARKRRLVMRFRGFNPL